VMVAAAAEALSTVLFAGFSSMEALSDEPAAPYSKTRKGLSIVVAPEGTRLDTQSVGPFKKGAFRIAMATGLPVVPIVIRNSDSIAGRNSTTINPGTVDVAVLPPVSTADWTVEDLRERIEEVRSAYVKLLADWPAPGAAL